MQQSSNNQRKDFVFLKSEYKLVRIDLIDILFLSGLQDYTKIFLNSKNTPLMTLRTLKDFEHKLPENFIRVHRSYIVSLCHVDTICRNELVIGAYIIPIGSTYHKLLEEATKWQV